MLKAEARIYSDAKTYRNWTNRLLSHNAFDLITWSKSLPEWKNYRPHREHCAI